MYYQVQWLHNVLILKFNEAIPKLASSGVVLVRKRRLVYQGIVNLVEVLSSEVLRSVKWNDYIMFWYESLTNPFQS